MLDLTIVTDADQGVHSISDNTVTVTGTDNTIENHSQLDYSTNNAMMPTVAALDANCSVSVPVKLGLIDCEVGNVQKRLLLVDGAVAKDGTHSLAITSGKHTDLVVDGLEGLSALLQGIKPTQALTLGISGIIQI